MTVRMVTYKDMANTMFSNELQKLLDLKRAVSLKELVDDFAEKGFALLFLLLMAVPALPIPTGGLTHIFELIVMLIALELIAGRQTIWLPDRWLKLSLSKKFLAGSLPKLISVVKKVEKYSKSRMNGLLASRSFGRVTGLVVLIFTLAAFLAPPFSGLDTLPSLGVVLIALGLLLEDLVLYLIGLIVGASGILLVFLLGSLVLKFI